MRATSPALCLRILSEACEGASTSPGTFSRVEGRVLTGVKGLPAACRDAQVSPAFLHNMSVPSRSVLSCARTRLPGRRHQVSCLADPGGSEARKAIGAMQRALDEHGAIALSAVLGLLDEGALITPPVLAARVAAACRPPSNTDVVAIERRLGTALARAGLPHRIGVFIELSDCAVGRDAAPLLDPIASLAVLVHRTGPLYVPSRTIEPSLVVLQPCVLVFPEELT